MAGEGAPHLLQFAAALRRLLILDCELGFRICDASNEALGRMIDVMAIIRLGIFRPRGKSIDEHLGAFINSAREYFKDDLVAIEEGEIPPSSDLATHR